LLLLLLLHAATKQTTSAPAHDTHSLSSIAT
jgi:hypothetical protein